MLTLDQQSLEAEASRLVRQMHAVNVSIGVERQRGNMAGVNAMLPVYKSLLEQYKAVSRQLGQADFTAFDRFVLDTGTYVSDTVTAIPGAVSALPKQIGEGLIKAALPFAALWIGYQFLRGYKFKW
jgi:hypothetical protein